MSLQSPTSTTSGGPAAPAPWPLFRDRRNVVQIPYRGVSVQPYDGAMTEREITNHLMGREAYRRTIFIVLKGSGERCALVAIGARDRESLFAPIEHVEVLALPESCVFTRDPDTDTANRTALAALAARQGVGVDGTLVCEGKFDHVNFIHHPDPLVIRVVEVAPPEPPKLYHLIEHVLSYADLPPIRVELERIELRALAKSIKPKAYLVPCRSGGLDDLGAPVYFLDERPPKRLDWVLVGCERSLQFHRHYYGDEPPRVELCPRVIAGKRNDLTLLKCCLLEFGIERDGNVAVVPWGADLAMVEQALRSLARDVDYL
jgi:hypothetical protein